MEDYKIKSLKVYKIHEKDGPKTIQLHREYDRNGNRLKEISYTSEEDILEEKNFKYNENGKLVEEKSHFIEDDVTEIMRVLYNTIGMVERTHKSYGDPSDEDTTYYSYNLEGKLIEKRTESKEGEIEHKETWKYEGKNLIEKEETNYDGKILERSKFSYTEKDEIIEELRYTSETEQELKIFYDYSVTGKSPDTTVYNKAGKIVQRTRNTFDEKQRLIKEITETVNLVVLKFTTHYLYDEQNNIIESSVFDKNEKLISKTVYKHNHYNLPIEEIHSEAPESGMDWKETWTLNEYEFYS